MLRSDAYLVADADVTRLSAQSLFARGAPLIQARFKGFSVGRVIRRVPGRSGEWHYARDHGRRQVLPTAIPEWNPMQHAAMTLSNGQPGNVVTRKICPTLTVQRLFLCSLKPRLKRPESTRSAKATTCCLPSQSILSAVHDGSKFRLLQALRR